MKKIIISVACLLFAFFTMAQSFPLFVAAKAGLSLREKPSASAKALDKIPYGEKISVSYESDSATIVTEGFHGAFLKTTWKGKTGYVVSSYLLPSPVPKATAKTIKDYLLQLTAPAGSPVIVKKGFGDDISTTLKKQLYKNGAEFHDFQGYEYHTETYILPDFTLEQGFLLLRLLKQYPEAIGENEPVPTANSTKKLANGERRIEILQLDDASGQPTTQRINIHWESGVIYELEMSLLNSELVIYISESV